MASANLQDTRNWRDWIQEDPGTAGHLIVKPPLKPVKPLPWSHMMAKRGDLFSQSPWIGDNLARQIGPQWLCQHVDHLTKMANSTMATISDYKLILEDGIYVKSVELPFVKGMKDLDFATYDNLEKVTGNSLSDQRNILTINPKYDGRLFDELHDQYVLFYIKLFCSKFKAL